MRDEARGLVVEGMGRQPKPGFQTRLLKPEHTSGSPLRFQLQSAPDNRLTWYKLRIYHRRVERGGH